jgi:hypothetical protein
VKTAPRWLAWILNRGGFRAITLPPFGVYAVQGYEQNERLARHEAVHWAQAERMGFIKFYFLYIWYSFRYGYKNNPMEIEARAAER